MANRGGGGTTGQKNDINFLLKTIEEKDEQLVRLQNKFRDVTHAYKSLLSEKQALEITVRALSAKVAPKSTTAAKKPLTPAASSSDLTAQQQASSRPSSAASSDVESADTNKSTNASAVSPNSNNSDDDKLEALMANMQVILEAKAKAEASFLADKKRMKAEYDEMKAKLELAKSEEEKFTQNYEAKIKELKTSLKLSHAEREKLTQDLNEQIKLKTADQNQKIATLSEENQILIINLRNENNDLKVKIKNLSRQMENKCEELTQSDKEFKQFKALYDQRLKDDEKQMAGLRNMLAEANEANEKRIADLEARNSELCLAIANYESKSSSSSNIASNNNIKKNLDTTSKSNEKLDFDSAIEQIAQLKSYVETTARELNIHFNFNELWFHNNGLDLNSNQSETQQKQKELQGHIDKLKEENLNLKEEFEKYKIRTNYLIKSAKQMSSKESSQNNDHELQQQLMKFKQEVELLKKRITIIEKEKQEYISTNLKISKENENQVNQLRSEFKTKFDRAEQNYTKHLNELEHELQKQRERTINLLREKDMEIQQYRESGLVPQQQSTTTTIASPLHKSVSTGDHHANSDGSSETVNNGEKKRALSLSTPLTVDTAGVPPPISAKPPAQLSPNNNFTNNLLLYSQQSAYKEMDLNKLRKAKNELEFRLKQTLDEHSVDTERYLTQIDVLKQEIERLKLNVSRSDMNSANQEYIKNVIFRLLTSKDENVKTSMTNAIVQILQFTKDEKQKIRAILNGKIV